MLKRIARRFGYELRPLEHPVTNGKHAAQHSPAPPPVEPVWPLPRRGELRSDDEIRAAFAEYPYWHYGYQFEGGLDFEMKHVRLLGREEDHDRALQRFHHFMPSVVAAAGGSLKGKRVLDIACNSGFWSLQCALLGAEVVGFDGRQELVDQANLLKRITGASVEFRVLDFWDMTPELLGTFDVVLNLGLLYHLAKPLEALERTRAMSRDVVLLDTGVYRSAEPLIKVRWEESIDIRSTIQSGVVMSPSKQAVERMFKHVGFRAWEELPIRSPMPDEYLRGGRASWVARV
jgi:tRNA (mo5U34)-methyltransferase